MSLCACSCRDFSASMLGLKMTHGVEASSPAWAYEAQKTMGVL